MMVCKMLIASNVLTNVFLVKIIHLVQFVKGIDSQLPLATVYRDFSNSVITLAALYAHLLVKIALIRLNVFHAKEVTEILLQTFVLATLDFMINFNLSKTAFSVNITVKNARIFLYVQLVEGIIETLILLYVPVKQAFLMMDHNLRIAFLVFITAQLV
jgi:hypothetical protein